MKAPQSDTVKELRRKGYRNHDILSFLLGEIELDGKKVVRLKNQKGKMKNPQLDLVKQLRRKGYTNHEIVRYLLDKIEKEGKHKNLSNRIKK